MIDNCSLPYVISFIALVIFINLHINWDAKMRLNDAYVEVAHKDGYGFYFYSNKAFKGWAVRFERTQYDVEKSVFKNGQIVDDFEEDNDRYRFLMAMIQSDGWEFNSYESSEHSEQSGSEGI